MKTATSASLTRRERSGIMEVLAAARSLLRDVLATQELTGADVVNEDAADIVDRLSRDCLSNRYPAGARCRYSGGACREPAT